MKSAKKLDLEDEGLAAAVKCHGGGSQLLWEPTYLDRPTQDNTLMSQTKMQ
jgi:hypothetical protein